MPNEMSKPNRWFTVQVAHDGTETEWFNLAECESPQCASAIVMALLSAERKPPNAIRIIPRMEVG